MPEQLFKIADDGTYLEDEPDRKGWQRVDGFVVRVEAYQKHEVCICLMSEGFDPQPPQKIHNNWCTYVEQTDDA